MRNVNQPIIQKYHITVKKMTKRVRSRRSLFMHPVPQNVQKTDRPLWTFAIFGDIIKIHVNIYIFYVRT